MISQKRGKNVAIAGAAAQLLFTAILLVIWLWTSSLAAMAGMMFLGGGVMVWLVSALLFYCRQLARQEQAELEDMAGKGGTSSSIFEGEQGQDVRPARSRVAWMEKWIIPLFTVLWAGYLGAMAVIIVQGLLARPEYILENTGQGMLLATLVGFLGFLFSRYATGMSHLLEWRLLRAPGSYLLVNVLVVAAMVGSLLAGWNGYSNVDMAIGFLIAALQMVLAVELLLNFVLDLYRPRLPGQEQRYSFDSRLFNLIAEPGRIGHSIAEAINYQFGFEVSKTWFYQLLGKAFVPLMIFSALSLIAMTSIMVVNDGEQYVVLHWGRAQDAQGNIRTLGPGIHFKLPWPVDSAKRFNVAQIQQVTLGAGEKQDPTIINGKEIFLWTAEHGRQKELDFLIAVPPESRLSSAFQKEKPPAVSVIKLVVPVQYVIKDVGKYGFKFTDPRKLLESVAYREMISYCASATLDNATQGSTDRPEAIMTYGRERAGAELKKRIQKRVDELDMGIEITMVGLQSAHPPAEAAPEFEKVIAAERRMDAKRYSAEAEANEWLVSVAGDPNVALQLAQAIRGLEELQRLQQLRGDERELVARLDDDIRVNREDIRSLTEEIQREKLLGKSREGDKSMQEQLLAERQGHLDLLLAIRSKPANFDYPGNMKAYQLRTAELFKMASGKAAVLIEQAQAYRWQREMAERSRYESFNREVRAYNSAPQVYMFDRWMDVWDEVLPGITKYVMGVDRDKLQVWLNWEGQTDFMENVTFQQDAAGSAPASK